jgi:hypothetical protein
MRRYVFAAAFLFALAEPAGAAVTTLDRHGTTLLDGRKVFPIVLAKGPERASTTPAGRDALGELASAGVNFLKIGPTGSTWSDADTADVVAWNREASKRGLYTWVNLSTLSRARPRSWQETQLRNVIRSLERGPAGRAIGMWKGAEEPWRYRVPPASLGFAYCLATSRRRADCAGRAPADSDHLWVTVQAPRGAPQSLARFSGVTDVHGVNHYPVSLGNPEPALHEVGLWTERLVQATPNRAVWTTLQICWSWSYDGSGNFALPTRREERYMVYDAILNGARSLAFYGGSNPNCWSGLDSVYRWNWTFWNDVLGDMVREINAASPIAPALVNPGSTRTLASDDPTVQVISRRGRRETDLWVIAARSGQGSHKVTISGLPSSATSGTVYTEGRSVSAADGSFTDTFERWDVHVYRFKLPSGESATGVGRGGAARSA